MIMFVFVIILIVFAILLPCFALISLVVLIVLYLNEEPYLTALDAGVSPLPLEKNGNWHESLSTMERRMVTQLESDLRETEARIISYPARTIFRVAALNLRAQLARLGHPDYHDDLAARQQAAETYLREQMPRLFLASGEYRPNVLPLPPAAQALIDALIYPHA